MPGRPKRKAAEETVEKAKTMAKRARGDTDLEWDLRWSVAGAAGKEGLHPCLVLSSDTLEGAEKIAGFDIDFTVIKTKSGRTFATGASDWTWWDDTVPEKLKELHNDGIRVMFFTNQAGIEKNKTKPDEMRKKIEDIIQQLGIPVLAFVSTGTTHFRKPSTMMWDHMVKNCNESVKPSLSGCIYVGDAAGRAKNWAPGKPKDFSCSDRMFAANIGIDFKTPEEFFLKEAAAPFQWHSVDPQTILSKSEASNEETYHSDSKELVLMVGTPASGKSTFSRRYLVPHGYVSVNRDTLGTPAKCQQLAESSLKAGKCVVVDNTNPSSSVRADYIKMAKKNGASCRCFVMNTPVDVAHHLNMVRMNQTDGQVRRIPDVGYNMYKKNYEEPKLAEGFSEIIKIDFVPKFDTARDESLFKQWTN